MNASFSFLEIAQNAASNGRSSRGFMHPRRLSQTNSVMLTKSDAGVGFEPSYPDNRHSEEVQRTSTERGDGTGTTHRLNTLTVALLFRAYQTH